MRVLGVDPSLRKTGAAVIETDCRANSTFSLITHECLIMPASLKISDCLRRISEGIQRIIEEFHPDSASLESGFYAKNVKTAMVLGATRGVVIAVCAKCDVPVYEYSPRRIKQAVVGFGGADKQQVCKMIVRLLNLQFEPGEDVADAMAAAICHIHSSTGHAFFKPERI